MLLSCTFPGGSSSCCTSGVSTESTGGSWEVIRIARMAWSRCHGLDMVFVPAPLRMVLGERLSPLLGSFRWRFMSPSSLPLVPCKSGPSSSGLGPATTDVLKGDCPGCLKVVWWGTHSPQFTSFRTHTALLRLAFSYRPNWSVVIFLPEDTSRASFRNVGYF
jgi:hypothetical protein